VGSLFGRRGRTKTKWDSYLGGGGKNWDHVFRFQKGLRKGSGEGKKGEFACTGKKKRRGRKRSQNENNPGIAS